jgi:hypothetical protein
LFPVRTIERKKKEHPMTDTKEKAPAMIYCNWHRLHEPAVSQCEGQRIIDEFEENRKRGIPQGPIDFKREIPFPQ